MRSFVLFLILVLGASVPAMADTKGGKKAEKTASNASVDRYFRALDLNGDGYVSIAEAAGDPVIVQRFDKGDRNRDGKLSEKEFANLTKVKVRVARAKKDKEKEASAAVGGSAPEKMTAGERRRQRAIKEAAEGGG